jgi:alternate signal-mediated exported protein
MNDNTKRSSRRVKGVIAGAAGVALLLGGSTFALWSATGSMTGSGSIKVGTMTIAADQNKASVYDVSTDRTGPDLIEVPVLGVPGQDVTAAAQGGSLEIVPGDTLAAVYPFTFNVKGDNLVAKMQLTTGSNAIAWGEDVTVTYRVKINDKFANDAASWDLKDDAFVGYFANGEDKAEDGIIAATDGAKVAVVVQVAFAKDATNATIMGVSQALQDVTVKLDQVRDVKGQWGTPTV